MGQGRARSSLVSADAKASAAGRCGEGSAFRRVIFYALKVKLHFFPSLESAAFDPVVCVDLMRLAQRGSDRPGAKGLLHTG